MPFSPASESSNNYVLVTGTYLPVVGNKIVLYINSVGDLDSDSQDLDLSLFTKF
jgi:hypothetical protein